MTQILKINKFNPEANIISQAAALIKSGELVAFPTETVYGLGADAMNPEAVAKIFRAKARPSDNPLILHICDVNQVCDLAHENDVSRAIMRKFFPAPLTLVLKAKDSVPEITRGGLDSVAIRMPDNPIAQSLIECSQVPIAAPSANLSGRPSPTDSQSVFQDMNGKIELILDGGGLTDFGIESTVIDVSNPGKIALLRPGAFAIETLEKFLNAKISDPDKISQPRSPGMKYKHYAPKIPVEIICPEELTLSHADKFANSGFVGVNPRAKIFFKSPVIFENVNNYARGLFFAFRELENQDITRIFVEWIPDSGIGRGLRDRISRAAGVGTNQS